MKKFIINNCMNYIEKNTEYDKKKLAEIKYGLEGLYLTLSKTILISILAFILGIFKEMIMFLLFYSMLRTFAFGLHATKSWICLITSTMLFIVVPYLCIILNIPIFIKILIGIFGIYFIFKNSPADTQKRPLINKKKRIFCKYISTLLTISFSIIAILIRNDLISNCLLFAIITQNLMISPIVYKIFKLPYNNYINYLKEHSELVQ